jgi:flavin reductase (DIM6/NTAB) family NADH-FMN oxidoreductase RutF
MFYRPQDGHGLPHNPFNALVVPRPIGWISSLAADGSVNLAPFSFFNAVSYTPPQVIFSGGPRPAPKGADAPKKDSVANVEATGEFVANLATWDLRVQMNRSSIEAPPDFDEFDYAGLTKAPAELVKPPRVAECLAHLECRYLQSVTLKALPGHGPNTIIVGEVIGIHIDERVLTDGMVDMAKLKPIGRLGYMDYCVVEEVFSMRRPRWPEDADK